MDRFTALIQRLVAGGLNVKMDLDHCSKTQDWLWLWPRQWRVSSELLVNSCHPFDVFLLLCIKIQTMSWKCSELSFFYHRKSLDMTVHLWQCHIWSPTQSAKCNAAMQHVTKCYMSPPRHQNMLPCSMLRSFSVFFILVWFSPILHDHGLLAVCAFIRVLQFLHWSKSICTR